MDMIELRLLPILADCMLVGHSAEFYRPLSQSKITAPVTMSRSFLYFGLVIPLSLLKRDGLLLSMLLLPAGRACLIFKKKVCLVCTASGDLELVVGEKSDYLFAFWVVLFSVCMQCIIQSAI